MVDGVTGIAGGMENKTSSNKIQASARMLITQPILLPKLHGAVFTPARWDNMDSAIGIPYDTASATTPTDTNALNAELEPRYIRLRSIWTNVVRVNAQMGVPC